jgi:hypothetical protein
MPSTEMPGLNHFLVFLRGVKAGPLLWGTGILQAFLAPPKMSFR